MFCERERGVVMVGREGGRVDEGRDAREAGGALDAGEEGGDEDGVEGPVGEAAELGEGVSVGGGWKERCRVAIRPCWCIYASVWSGGRCGSCGMRFGFDEVVWPP